MKKVIFAHLIMLLMFSGVMTSESCTATPKKKSSLEKRMKKQNKKKKRKGDTTCPKIDC